MAGLIHSPAAVGRWAGRRNIRSPYPCPAPSLIASAIDHVRGRLRAEGGAGGPLTHHLLHQRPLGHNHPQPLPFTSPPGPSLPSLLSPSHLPPTDPTGGGLPPPAPSSPSPPSPLSTVPSSTSFASAPSSSPSAPPSPTSRSTSWTTKGWAQRPSMSACTRCGRTRTSPFWCRWGWAGEWLGYRAIIGAEFLFLLVTYVILIWAEGLRWMQLMQVTFGFTSAAQSCVFFTYIYQCCPAQLYHTAVSRRCTPHTAFSLVPHHHSTQSLSSSCVS